MIITGCSSVPASPPPTPKPTRGPSFAAPPSAGLRVPPSTQEELVAKSSVVVIGTVSYDEPTTRNIHGRDPSDPSKPDPNFISVGSIYQVNVERYLKGSGGDTLPVVQLESIITNTGRGVNESRRREADFPLTKGTRYLLSLKSHAQAPDLWFGAAEPYRWVLSSGQAKVETPFEGARAMFPDTSEADLVTSVEAFVDGG